MCYYNYYMSLWVHMILSYYSASWESCHRNRRETQKSLVTSATTFASNFAKSITKYLKSISNISKFIKWIPSLQQDTASLLYNHIQCMHGFAWICYIPSNILATEVDWSCNLCSPHNCVVFRLMSKRSKQNTKPQQSLKCKRRLVQQSTNLAPVFACVWLGAKLSDSKQAA